MKRKRNLKEILKVRDKEKDNLMLNICFLLLNLLYLFTSSFSLLTSATSKPILEERWRSSQGITRRIQYETETKHQLKPNVKELVSTGWCLGF